jgi:uncharacterized OB-fold protein
MEALKMEDLTGPAPVPTPETAPFWEATARHELSIQRCKPNQHFYFYPRPACPECGTTDVEWVTVSGDAKLISYIINHRPLPPFQKDTKVIIALVELAEGPHMMTNIVGVPPEPESLELDMALRVDFMPRGEVTLPVFVPKEA